MAKQELNSISNDLSREQPQSLPNDKPLVELAEDESGFYWDQYKRRDVLYSNMLEHYLDVHTSKARWNTWFKLVFFTVIMLVFLVLICAPMAAIVIIALKEDVNWEHVALVVSGLAGIITSIMVLPKIIAEHLFPTNEDQNMIGIVENMQKNDSRIRSSFRRKKSNLKQKK